MQTLTSSFHFGLMALMLVTLPALAATEEWNTPAVWNQIHQVVAGGKGGCAVFGPAPGGFYVGWYDKKGFFAAKVDKNASKFYVTRYSHK